jgi:hypothetical protein
MKHITKVTILISALAFLNACDRNDVRIFNEIYELTDQKNLFKAI